MNEAKMNIRNEATRLAKAHGIDFQRTCDALERIVTSLAPELMDDPLALEFAFKQIPLSLDDSVVPEVVFERFPLSLLEEALACLPPDDALALIEGEGLALTAWRVSAADYLSAPESPLHSLSDLADRTELFTDFIDKQQRTNLLDTGQPAVEFSTCPLLRDSLGNLYPDAGIDLALAGAESQVAAAELKRLQTMRGKLLDLKIAVLDQLLVALRWGNVGGSWDREWKKCLSLLAETLSAEDVDACLRLDGLYQLRSDNGAQRRLAPGGLTNLFEIIGHIAKEKSIGTFARSRELLGDLIVQDLRAPGKRESSYFRLIGRHDRKRVNDALASLSTLADQELAFWKQYWERVVDAVDNEFFTEVVTRTKIKRGLTNTFQTNVQAYADWAAAQLQTTGSLPTLRVSLVKSPDPAPLYVFRRQGSSWTIQFRNERASLPDQLGLFYVAYLLERPGQAVTASALRAAQIAFAAAGRPITTRTDSTDDMPLSLPDDSGPIFNAQAKKDYRQRLDALQLELEKATKDNTGARIAEIQREITWLKKELSRGVGINGRDRKMSSQPKKDRDAVCNAIERTRSKLTQQAPDLAQHLANSLQVSGVCSYRPETPIPWEL